MSHPSRVSPLFASLLLLPLITGCGKKKRDSCPRYEQVRRVPATARDVVVAEVNGRPIHASEVRHRAREAGLGVREALSELVDEELMVQEAERLGLQRDRSVVEAGKQAAIWALLRHDFEKEYTRKDVPEVQLRRVYRANAATRFHRPEIRRFVHLLVNRALTRRNRKLVALQPQDDELRRKMEALRKAVIAAHPADWQEFKALEKLPQAKAIGARTGTGTLPRHRLMKPFGDALWALSKPGQITPVVTTEYWHHIAYLVQIIPGTDISFEKARPEILDVVWPLARKKAFADTLRKLRHRCRITTHPEHLPVTPLGDDEPGDGPAPPKRAPGGP